ncbi:MAG: hypothetical protein K9L32_06700 [Chromatiaceae bacterium]|nr:hypothetical protein [Chromatiaceae bacterium]
MEGREHSRGIRAGTESSFHGVEDLTQPSRLGLGRVGVLGRQLLEGGDFLLVEGLFPSAPAERGVRQRTRVR